MEQSGAEKEAKAQDHIDGDMGPRDIELVRPDHLDHGPAQAVARQVDQKELAVELLMLPEKKEEDQKAGVPHSFIKEGGMDLDAAVGHMDRQFFRDVGLPDHGRGDPHGKEALGIAAEDLPVEKVPPPADDLAQGQARHAGVQDPDRRDLSPPAENDDGQDAGDDAAVDGQPASPEVEDLKKVGLIHVPHEDHVIDPGSQDGKDHEPDVGAFLSGDSI